MMERINSWIVVAFIAFLAGCATTEEKPVKAEPTIVGRWAVLQVWDEEKGITDVPPDFRLTMDFHQQGMVAQDRDGVVTSATYRMENDVLVISLTPERNVTFKELSFQGDRLIMTQVAGDKEGTVTWGRIRN